MAVMDKARELAEEIKSDEIMKEYVAARTAYEGSVVLQTKMTEYNAQRSIMSQEFSREVEEQSPELLRMVKERMETLAHEISELEEYKNFSAAQLRVTDMMNRVNAEIQRIVFGVEPDLAENCTHDCSTCQANCSSKK